MDRSDVTYRLTFVPDLGIGQAPTVLATVIGPDAAANRAEELLLREYESSDWLDDEAGYKEFRFQNMDQLSLFREGTISVVALMVPYGVILVS